MAEFRMPSLGADMDSGVLLEWLVKPGDAVKHGDIVAVVDTSKAEIEIEVFEDGIVEQLLVGVGERVPVGTPIAMIGAGVPAQAAPPTAVAVAAAPGGNGTTAAAEVAAELPAPTPPRPPAPAAPAAEHRRRISPIARRTAALLGVDLRASRAPAPAGRLRRATSSARRPHGRRPHERSRLLRPPPARQPIARPLCAQRSPS